VKRLIATAIVALAATASGCSASDSGPVEPEEPQTVGSRNLDDKLYAETITLPDGRVITCVVLENWSKDYSYGGVSCDWDTANGVFEEPR